MGFEVPRILNGGCMASKPRSGMIFPFSPPRNDQQRKRQGNETVNTVDAMALTPVS